MKPIEEQIFDRRCDAARDGREMDVRFYDEIFKCWEDIDQIKQECADEVRSWQDTPCEDCSRNERTIDELESEIKDLKAEITALQDQIQHGNS